MFRILSVFRFVSFRKLVGKALVEVLISDSGFRIPDSTL